MKWILLFSWVFLNAVSYSQTGSSITHSLPEGIDKISQAVNHWNKSQMDEAKTIFTDVVSSEPNNYRALYWSAYADYRLAIYYLYADETPRDEDAGKRYIESAIAGIEKAIENNSQDADCYALLGSLTGMKIMFNPISGMWLGPKSNGHLDKALLLNDKNPRVVYLKGMNRLKSPSIFGGGPDKAIEQFEKAIVLFEAERQTTLTDPLIPRWGIEECYSFLGNAYEKLGEINKARVAYQKALDINPSSLRAKKELANVQNK